MSIVERALQKAQAKAKATPVAVAAGRGSQA